MSRIVQADSAPPEPSRCRLGYPEAYDGDRRYCHEHGAWTLPHDPTRPWLFGRCTDAVTP